MQQRDRLADAVAALAEELDRLGRRLPRARGVAAAELRDRQRGQRSRDVGLHVQAAAQPQALLQHGQRLVQVALRPGQCGADVQRVRARHGHAVHRRQAQQRAHRGAALAGAAAHDPEILQGHCHLHGDQRVDTTVLCLRHAHPGAQVVLLQVEPVEPLALLGALHAVAAALGEVEVVLAMPRGRGRRGIGVGQLLRGVFADCLEHAEAALADALLHHDERLVDQRRQQVQHLVGFDLVVGAHGLGGGQVKAAGEDGQPLQHRLFLRLQQLVGPIDQAAQRLLAPVAQLAAAGQELEAVLQAAVDVDEGQRAQPGRGQFQRQRDAFQARHEFGHRRGFGRRELEVGPLFLGTRHEQPHGGGAQQGRHAVRRRRHRQRQDGVGVLAMHTQGHAARRHHRHLGRQLQDGVDQGGRGLEHVLAVVDDEQRAPVLEVLRHRLQQCSARLLAHA